MRDLSKHNQLMKLLLVGVSAVASAPAFAQQGVVETTEIVVTAQKRTERLFDVPIAMNALDSSLLDKRALNSSIEIGRVIPNLYSSSTAESVNAVVFMRGVGSDDFNITSEGGVGIYVDEVFIRTPHAQVFGLPDIARVEVLRGPQGTLYGRNTSGGAISFHTRRPTDDFEGTATIRVGNYGRTDAEGTISGPIVPGVLRARITGQTLNRRGLVRNDIGRSVALDPDLGSNSRYRSEDNWTVRGVVDASPTDKLEIILGADFTRSRSIGNGSSHVGTGPGGTDVTGYRDADGNPFTGEFNFSADNDYDAYGGSFRVIWDMGRVSLTSVTGLRYFDLDAQEDSDASPNTLGHFFFRAKEDQVSQEIRLASKGWEKIDWLIGLYYFHETASAIQAFDIPTLAPPPFGAIVYTPNQTTDAYAAFGQLTYRFTDKLTLTLGIRGNYEKKDFSIGVEARDQFLSPAFAFPLFNVQARENWSKVSPRINVAYRASDNLNLYATVSQGFKAGGFNGAAASPVAAVEPYDPETITAYEVGLKSRLFGHAVDFNAAAFYYDYRDLQVFFIRDVGGAATTFLDNAAQAKIYGAELELSARPVERLNLVANLGLLKTKYEDFILDGVDLSGNQLVRAPKMTAFLSADYTIPLAGGNRFTVGGDYNYQSKHFFSPRNDIAVGEDGYGLFNLQASFETEDGRFRLSGWVKNLTDERYVRNGAAVPAPLQIITNNYGTPRTYGLTARVRL